MKAYQYSYHRQKYSDMYMIYDINRSGKGYPKKAEGGYLYTFFYCFIGYVVVYVGT